MNPLETVRRPEGGSPGAAVARSARTAARDLFLSSFVVLFLELAAIRWFGSFVVFLGFFTNIVLLASVLGMTAGCLAASRRFDLVRTALPVTLFAMFLSVQVLHTYEENRDITIDVGNQEESPQEIFFGTNYRPRDPSQFVLPIEVMAGGFYLLVAAMFLGPGQVLGRAFSAYPRPIGAYAWNVLGSLVGIVAFFAASWFETTPHSWFALGGVLVAFFLPRRTLFQVACLVGIVFLAGRATYGDGESGEIRWSPYYKVRYERETGEIYVNNITHQGMVEVETAGPAYLLPHLLRRDSGHGSFRKVLIIGAGSGNDVRAALAMGAVTVDAVEIDPVMQSIGRADHPGRPYEDDRVTVTIDDGRHFLRTTKEKYDLVIYALVDSLVLHSGYSSVRLESYLFTREAFEDVRKVLEPDGVFALYNYYRWGWVVGRIERMAREVFENEPVVLSLPFQERITPQDDQTGHFTCILAGTREASSLERVRERLATDESYWLAENPSRNEGDLAFGPKTPEVGAWERIEPARVDSEGVGPLPTDSWPFLYLKDARIPDLNLRGIGILALLSAVFLLVVAPRGALAPSGRMFFLGAGFMLLETKGVVHMALLFGSTWVVSAVVFFAVLVLVLLANLLASWLAPRRLWPAYVALFVALAVGALVPMEAFLSLPPLARAVLSSAVVFLPILFAGVIFSTSLARSARPESDFGWNVAGVVLGGLSENLSLVLGFERLLLVAAGFYLLSALLGRRHD